MKLAEKTLKQTWAYRGKIVDLRVDDALLPNGSVVRREVVEHPGGVCVAPLTGKNELIFVRQFRYPYKEIVLELPAGKLERGEAPLPAGKRELKEETGAEAKTYVPLGKLYPSPGYTDEIIYLYLAEGLTFGNQKLDEDEFLETEKIPLEKAFELVMDGRIADSKTQVAVLKTFWLTAGSDGIADRLRRQMDCCGGASRPI